MSSRCKIRAGIAAFFTSASAAAHAPPIGNDIYWYAHGTTERMVVRTNRGLVVSDDGGATFQLLCNEAFSVAATEIAPMSFTEDGRVLLVSAEAGLLSDDGTLCNWSPAGGPVAGIRGVDLARDAMDPETFYLVVSRQGSDENFFVSHDSGRDWLPAGPSPVVPTGVLVAPSDSNRIYRIGAEFDPEGQLSHVVEVSSDGAASWEKHEIPLQANELRLLPMGVDPSDSDRVYLRAEAASREFPERLLVSTDGGATFVTALTGGVLQGFALSPDGTTVWVGEVDGLHRSVDRGATFEKLPASDLTRFGCLAAHEGDLFACAIQENEFGVSVSKDGGMTFERFLRFPDVSQPLSCPEGTQGKALCEVPFSDWANELFIGRDAGAASAGGAAASAGAGGTGPTVGGSGGGASAMPPVSETDSKTGSCACGLERRARSRVHWVWVGLAAVVVLRHRQKRAAHRVRRP